MNMQNENFWIALVLVLGLILLEAGIAYSVFYTKKRNASYKRNTFLKKAVNLLDSVTNNIPLRYLKREITYDLELVIPDEVRLKAAVNGVIAGMVSASLILFWILKNVGQLWYVKLLIGLVCFALPYYAVSLVFEVYRSSVVKNIPSLIDLFRSAFLSCNKLKPALWGCSQNTGGAIGKILANAADSPNFEQGLQDIKNRYKNIWLNIFIILLLNYKEDGGQLVGQLYKLSQTIGRVNGMEKKRNKRLILYEVFSILACLFSIPVIFWINHSIIGSFYGVYIIDARTNMIIARIILFSILSLVIIRVLRRI